MEGEKVIKEKAKSGKGSIRKISPSAYECVIQSSYINPKTGTPKRIKRRGKTEAEARKNAKMALTAWEKELLHGQDAKIDKSKTFGEYVDDYLKTQVQGSITDSTFTSYYMITKRMLIAFPIANYQLQMLNIPVFEDYYRQLMSKYAWKSCLTPIQIAKRTCKWLVERSLLAENYAEAARIKKKVSDEYDFKKAEDLRHRKKVFTPEDIQKFYWAYKNNVNQYACVTMFLLETGMRPGEFAALRNSSIDMEKGRIYVRETRSVRYKDLNDPTKGFEMYVKVPKNGEERYLIMSDLCKEVVQYMRNQTKLNCKDNVEDLLYPVFLTGKRRTESAMNIGFNSMCNKLGIDRDVHVSEHGQKKGLSLYSLRHTADTIANTAKGANVVNTALAMGHKAISVENVYTHATDEALASVTTPSQAILDQYKKEEPDKEKELYEMYLKLKEKFESEN